MLFLADRDISALSIAAAIKGGAGSGSHRHAGRPGKQGIDIKSIKGGEGSGFHGHAGRPGQRGGSAPAGSSPTVAAHDEIKTAIERHHDQLASENYETDPVIRAWLGGDVGIEYESEFRFQRLEERTPYFKNVSVSALTEIGISYNDANGFIKSWAESSNQGYMAQLIQRTASELFDAPYSDWQQSLWEQENRRWDRDFNAQIEYLNFFDEIDSETAERLREQALSGLPFPDLARARFDEIFPDGLEMPLKQRSISDVVKEQKRIETGVRQLRNEQTAIVAKALRSIYDRTQSDLKKQGIEEVILYRGFGAKQSAFDLGDEIEVTSNALSSWSADDRTAKSFAMTAKGGGTAIAIKVNAARVFSTPRTGFGCLNEWEFVLLGQSSDRATIIAFQEDGKLRSMKSYQIMIDGTKGGPGSGFHGHAGRPGQRGGSAAGGGPLKKKYPKLSPAPNDAKIISASKKLERDTQAGDPLSWQDDPILRDLIDYGDEFASLRRRGGSLTQSFFLEKQAQVQKHRVVTDLAARAGLAYDEANDFVAQWADSSNDNDLRSLSIQEVACDLTGIPLSDWQKSRIEKTFDYRNAIINRMIADTDEAPDTPLSSEAAGLLRNISADGTIGTMFERAELEKMAERVQSGEVELKTLNDVRTLLVETEAAARTKIQRAVSAMYEGTQERLRDLGVTKLRLYRGSVLEGDFSAGKVATVKTNALSSWSMDYAVARDFADGGISGQGVIIEAIVPAERIYAIPSTGVGCLSEYEVVVIGGTDRVRVRLAQT
ncbi:MAG TPA: hypothetical protein PKH77_17790 [Anaerolineae bacterium]|nr:hypothetical protein [Anaerolineae bacterium]